MNKLRFPIKMLGQSGFRLKLGETVLYVDPYLSNAVYEQDSRDFIRMVEASLDPNEITDADYLLITHAHLDHCDPDALPQIAKASPNAIFLGPVDVCNKLKAWGIDSERLISPGEHWMILNNHIKIHAIPAAHPDIERDGLNNLKSLGCLVDFDGKLFYIAGDTLVHDEVMASLKCQPRIDVAFLPVNEDNYFRRKRGIVGNMSIREALEFASYLGIKNVVPVHWDMFKINSASLEEIDVIYKNGGYEFKLLISPKELNLSGIETSIIIRTLNEERYLSELLSAIKNQNCFDETVEIIVVDSGSTDKTLAIAETHGCVILTIQKCTFTFGRSLNIGCEQASGNILVIISGHCVPINEYWLKNLCEHLGKNKFKYVYGRQIGGVESYFSEKQIFEKMYPSLNSEIVDGLYCNNANSALLKSEWFKFGFDPEITGLEDLEMASKILADGGRVGYASKAVVYHYHKESWAQITRRFEREAYALQQIKNNIHLKFTDAFYFLFVSIFSDCLAYFKLNAKSKNLINNCKEIFLYRLSQYIGSWRGSNKNRKPTQQEKLLYFYPTANE